MTALHAVAEATSTPEALAALAAFREERVRGALGPRGAAAFVWGDFVTRPGTHVFGAAGTWEPLPDGRAGLRVHAAAAEGVRIGGALVEGAGDLFLDAADGPVVAHFAGGAEGVVFSDDRRRLALQVWDAHSEWAAQFGGISAYPHDPAWAVQAEVEAVRAGTTVSISHQRDPRQVDVPVVARLRFESEGEPTVLVATRGVESDLFVHFTDATSDAGSYASGRGLQVDLPAGADTVELDFNYASLLPCAFSLAWNCPLPPEENALPFPVRAGERHAVDARGTAIL